MAAQICEYCLHKNEDCYCSPNSTCKDYEPFGINISFLETEHSMAIGKPKFTGGSKITFGEGRQDLVIYNIDQHFNWFQKLMWKWCFGAKVEDYSEE